MNDTKSVTPTLPAAKPIEPWRLARRVLWLAYQASFPMGLGALHYRNDLAEGQVWRDARGTEAEAGNVYADYLHGRMMKTAVEWDANGLRPFRGTPRDDYQSWATKYPTYAALVEAAEKSLREGR